MKMKRSFWPSGNQTYLAGHVAIYIDDSSVEMPSSAMSQLRNLDDGAMVPSANGG